MGVRATANDRWRVERLAPLLPFLCLSVALAWPPHRDHVGDHGAWMEALAFRPAMPCLVRHRYFAHSARQRSSWMPTRSDPNTRTNKYTSRMQDRQR